MAKTESSNSAVQDSPLLPKRHSREIHGAREKGVSLCSQTHLTVQQDLDAELQEHKQSFTDTEGTSSSAMVLGPHSPSHHLVTRARAVQSLVVVHRCTQLRKLHWE